MVVVGGDQVETGFQGARNREVVPLQTAVDRPSVRGVIGDVAEAAVDVAAETSLEEAAVQVVAVQCRGIQQRLQTRHEAGLCATQPRLAL